MREIGKKREKERQDIHKNIHLGSIQPMQMRIHTDRNIHQTDETRAKRPLKSTQWPRLKPCLFRKRKTQGELLAEAANH
eukprot:1395521-Amorphochlora_amoeboformis.AAC.1